MPSWPEGGLLWAEVWIWVAVARRPQQAVLSASLGRCPSTPSPELKLFLESRSRKGRMEDAEYNLERESYLSSLFHLPLALYSGTRPG